MESKNGKASATPAPRRTRFEIAEILHHISTDLFD